MKNKEANKIRENLEEKFKQLLPDDNAPEELKEEVFNTLDTFNLMGDIVDLFTTKFSQSESHLLDMMQDNRQED